MIEFKKLKNDSVVTLINLVNKVFEDYVVPVNWSLDQFEKDIKENSISDEESFLVFKDRKPVGFSVISLRGMKARIDSFGVLKEYRGTGLASEILFRSLESLKWKGAESIILEVAELEKRAIRFYEKHGFKTKRFLHSFKIKTNNYDYKYNYTNEDNKWVHDIAFSAKHNLHRQPNWQRDPKTLELSEDRYKIERITSQGFTVGYLVWGDNLDNSFIVDSSPIVDNTKYDDIVSDVIKYISKKGKEDIIIVAVPENDPLFDSCINNNFSTFIKQWEMEKRIH